MTGEALQPRIIEVKHQLDGAEQRFDCALVRRTPSLLLVRFGIGDTTPDPFLEALESRFGPAAGPLDSYGCFWPRRSYICYHIVLRGDGSEWMTRFDVVRGVRLAPDEVHYTDLLLDLWSDRAGMRWEDEDEVEAARLAGSLSVADIETIDRARGVLTRRHRTVVREVRGLLGLEDFRRRD